MNRSTSMLSLVAGTALALMVGFTGCSQSGTTAPVATETQAMLYSATLPDPDMTESQINDASLDMQMVPVPPQNDKRRLPFGDLLRALKLDSTQMAAVKDLLKSHEDCMKAAMDALRASERAIVDQAKAQRDAIIAQVKAGTLDRKSAGEQLRALNQATRDALKNNPARTDAMAARKACDDAFFESLRGILTGDQAAILTDWLAKRAAGNPSGPRNPKDSSGRGPGGPDTTGRGPGGRGPGGPGGPGGRGPHGPGDGDTTHRGGDTTVVRG
jgi:hypothetical protein